VTATLVDGTGATVATLGSGQRAAGERSFPVAVGGVPDGIYTIVLRARGRTTEVNARVALTVNRTLGYVGASERAFSPNGDGRLDTVYFGFLLTKPADVHVRVVRGRRWVATVAKATRLEGGAQAIPWDGRKPSGRIGDGDYEVEVTAIDELGVVSQRAPFAVDTTPPALRLVSLRPLRVRVWEPVRLTIQLNGLWRTIDRSRPGLVPIPSSGTVRTLRVVARDAVGNASAPLIYRR
jgi:hypothetical protein